MILHRLYGTEYRYLYLYLFLWRYACRISVCEAIVRSLTGALGTPAVPLRYAYLGNVLRCLSVAKPQRLA